jgi:hypothetical protein
VRREKIALPFKNYEEFWQYCNRECPDKKPGCAYTCALRKLLHIPPHGSTYVGKLQGPIEGIQ